jgi:hypothetical protein
MRIHEHIGVLDVVARLAVHASRVSRATDIQTVNSATDQHFLWTTFPK